MLDKVFVGAARILVVEDECAVRALAAAILRGAGYDVEVSAEPKEAIELLKNQCVHLLLSDVLMPGMNGHELAQHVAKHCPVMRVLLMSGYDPAACDACPYSPRCNILHKPFTRDQILDAVRIELANSAPPEPQTP